MRKDISLKEDEKALYENKFEFLLANHVAVPTAVYISIYLYFSATNTNNNY